MLVGYSFFNRTHLFSTIMQELRIVKIIIIIYIYIYIYMLGGDRLFVSNIFCF